jgi:PAS domain S-box-containing protein
MLSPTQLLAGDVPIQVTAVVLRDFPPLYHTDSDNKPAGFAIDLLSEVARQANWSLQYLTVENWDQAVVAVREGRADLSPAMSITQTRERELLFSGPLEVTPVSCFVRASDREVHGCDDLTNRRVAVIKQGAVHQLLAEKSGIRLITAVNLETALFHVLGGDADVLAAPRTTVLERLRRTNMEDHVRIVGQPLMELKRAMMFRKDRAEWLSTTNRILAKFKETSQYAKLQERYYGSPVDAGISGSVMLFWMMAGTVLALGAAWWWRIRHGSGFLIASQRSFAEASVPIHSRSGFLHRKATAWIVLVGSIVATLVVWRVSVTSVENRANDRLEYRVEEAQAAIHKRMLEYEQVLRGGTGFFDAVPGGINRASWRKYVETLRIETYWPGIQGIGFSLMIAPDEKETHIQSIRTEGYPEYTIRPEGEREQYSSIIYLEPFRERNLRAFGYDMYSEPVRRAAMEQARDSGTAAISGKVKLVQETATDVQAGTLMYIPVYKPDMPVATVEDRRTALLGFVYSPFRMKDLMGGILGHGIPDIDFELFDGPDAVAEQLLYSSHDQPTKMYQPTVPKYNVIRSINLPGRVWTVRFQSRPGFEQDMESWQPFLLLVSGGVISLLLFVLFRSLAGRQERILLEAQRMSRELHQAEERYQSMVENIKELIFQIDEEGRWSFLNPAWEEISGNTVEDSLGRNFLDYVCAGARERMLKLFQSLVEGKLTYFREEVCSIHRNGMDVWVEIYATAQRDDQGEFTKVFGTMRDVSTRRQAELAARQAREAAESANRAKSEFLANMSHELRTPLNSLLILAKLLSREGNLTPDQVESAQVIHNSGLDLLRLINDILDLSKVEAGRMDVVGESMEFQTVLDALQRQFRALAISRRVNFRLELGPDLPSGMVTDWLKVEQILRNLLSNAFKFTHQGTVMVRIHRPETVEMAGSTLNAIHSVAFTVSDTGIGIPEDKLELIFETFQQVDGATSRKYGGTGLGLSIVRRFAQLLGGEVRLKSRLGEGSFFTLLLPLEFPFPDKVRESLPDGEVVPLVTQENFDATWSTVLVVDDDERNRFAVGKILENRVGRILYAEDGVKALQLLYENSDVNLVLMDIMMPNMDGYQAMAEIRRQSRFVNLPIIALTAKAMPGDRQRCLDAGANDYLSKPLQVEQLFGTMNELLHVSSTPLSAAMTATVSSSLMGSSPSPSLSPPLTKQGRPLTILLVDDDMRSSFSLAKVLQSRVGNVLIAADGVKALQQLAAHPEVDLVLMDTMMPTMDGYETMRTIRCDPGRSDLPILAMTAKDRSEDEALCLEAGADACLTKPVDTGLLWSKLEQMLAVA